MLLPKEKELIDQVKANWSPISIPGELVKIIERLTSRTDVVSTTYTKPVRSERFIPPVMKSMKRGIIG